MDSTRYDKTTQKVKLTVLNKLCELFSCLLSDLLERLTN
ncbi:MAG: helix-turn-helix domain-containing protein [Pseudomonadaceae bacterium]|nr:helix-turn-helix domain-containing protein [Pseudomonadaceae bacterium]